MRAPASRSSAVLRPQECLAAVLGGHDVALACEALTLRARSDVAAGREREAALQLRVALESTLSELTPSAGREVIPRRTAELREERATVAAAANMAIDAGLDAGTAGEVAVDGGGMVGRTPGPDANAEFSGEVVASRCAITGVVVLGLARGAGGASYRNRQDRVRRPRRRD